MPRDPLMYALQFAITAGAIAYIVNLMRKQKFKDAAVIGVGKRALKAPASVWWLGWGGLVFWIALIALTIFFPGKTTAQGLVFARYVFGFFALLSVYVVLSCLVVIEWDNETVTGPNLWGKKLVLSWNDIVDCSYKPMLQALTLTDSDSRTIWIPEYWVGVDDFMHEVRQRRPGLRIFTTDSLRRWND
jgi:hypothetical protein